MICPCCLCLVIPHAVAGLISCLQEVGGWSRVLIPCWSCHFGAYHVGSGLVLTLCCSSPWWQHWWWADTATPATFTTTGIELVLPLWASLSVSAGGNTTVVGFITLSLCWSCHHGGCHNADPAHNSRTSLMYTLVLIKPASIFYFSQTGLCKAHSHRSWHLVSLVRFAVDSTVHFCTSQFRGLSGPCALAYRSNHQCSLSAPWEGS